jgi:hypothetical protein
VLELWVLGWLVELELEWWFVDSKKLEEVIQQVMFQLMVQKLLDYLKG